MILSRLLTDFYFQLQNQCSEAISMQLELFMDMLGGRKFLTGQIKTCMVNLKMHTQKCVFL